MVSCKWVKIQSGRRREDYPGPVENVATLLTILPDFVEGDIMDDQYYGNEYVDSVCMMINGLGKRCQECKKPTFNRFLVDDKCPVCRGKAKPTDYGMNGGRRCDTFSGPCSCGAWH